MPGPTTVRFTNWEGSTWRPSRTFPPLPEAEMPATKPDKIEKFWVVWNPNHGLPRHRHTSKSVAEAEAKRLASQHQGQEFHVLESVRTAKAVSVVLLDHEEVPF